MHPDQMLARPQTSSQAITQSVDRFMENAGKLTPKVMGRKLPTPLCAAGHSVQSCGLLFRHCLTCRMRRYKCTHKRAILRTAIKPKLLYWRSSAGLVAPLTSQNAYHARDAGISSKGAQRLQPAAACTCMAPPRTLYLVLIHAEVIAVALIRPTAFLRLHGLLSMCLYAIGEWTGCRAPRILGPDLPLRLTNSHPGDGAPSSPVRLLHPRIPGVPQVHHGAANGGRCVTCAVSRRKASGQRPRECTKLIWLSKISLQFLQH